MSAHSEQLADQANSRIKNLQAQVDELKAKILEQEAQIVTLIGAAEDLLNETTRKNDEGWTSLGLAGEELENAIAAIITGEKT